MPDRGGKIRGLALGCASLERQGIPREFTTKSRAIIISNDWRTLDRNVAALQDRGHVLLFRPSATEVHRHAGTWFDDAEIYQWFAANLHRVLEPSLRHYVRAKELKAAGMDWTEILATQEENRRARLAAELLASTAYDTTAERVQAFVEQGGGCRATFFNYRRRLGEGRARSAGRESLTLVLACNKRLSSEHNRRGTMATASPRCWTSAVGSESKVAPVSTSASVTVTEQA